MEHSINHVKQSFMEVMCNIVVASSMHSVRTTNQYRNISGHELLAKLRCVAAGQKEGSHFLRCALKTDEQGKCLSRCDKHTQSLARLVIIDCDSRIDLNGEIYQGAPCPKKISEILREQKIAHILYGSHSHYVGNKGNRYRLIMLTQTPYTKAQLTPTMEQIVTLINANLRDELLVNVSENSTWAQPWYHPRKPEDCDIAELYFEYLDADTIKVASPKTLTIINRKTTDLAANNATIIFDEIREISAIHAFNEQYPLPKLLQHYGYKKIYATENCEKWLSPDSNSGIPGITVWGNRFYSHHSDGFNDNKPHDSFDLMKIKECLSHRDAVIKAAKITKAPNGLSVDEHNKSLVRTRICRHSSK
jgi:hypothetical protein